MPRGGEASRTPRLLNSITHNSGILDRRVKPGDDDQENGVRLRIKAGGPMGVHIRAEFYALTAARPTGGAAKPALEA